MRNRFLLFSALLVFLMALGCSEKPNETSSTTPQEENINLEDEFGGYTATNEAPAFNDPALAAEAEGEVAYSDPMENEDEVESICNDSLSGWFHFRAIWGHLQYDSTSTNPTDWTGSLTISRGALLVRRIIRFEPATDTLLPRSDRKVVEWVSQTTVHNDGVAVDVVVPRPKPVFDTTVIPLVDSLGQPYDSLVIDTSIDNTPVTLTFATGPYSRTFTLNELSKLDTIIDLTNDVSVAFASHRRERVGCPKGFLAGFWGPDSTGMGAFRGYWVSKFGLIDGYLQGHYGVDSAGEHVFFGKWISMSGEFEGFLRGTYKDVPNTNSHAENNGWFRGQIYNADTVAIGQLHGHYLSRPVHAGRGFFAGRWKLDCGEVEESDDGF